MSLSKKLFLIFGITALITTGFTILYRKNNSGEWIAIQESKITEAIYGLATLESDEIFRYRVGITSQIKKLFVKEGASVKKGDPLLQLSEGAIIRTPIDGVVTQLDTKESETVFPNINLVTVMNLQKVALNITLEQTSAIRVSPALPVKIQFESIKGTPIDGKVRSVYPKDGQFVVKVDLKETPSSILPGMTADTAIIVGEKQSALIVPVRSIQRGVLTIRENGKTKKITVKTGFQDSANIELLESPDTSIKAGMEVWVSKK
jgi:macrolide-specific efflux system membrane fusion protein